jgi:hypothetical protein
MVTVATRNQRQPLSRKAAFAVGALTLYVKPKMAADHAYDNSFNPTWIMRNVTARNFAQHKRRIIDEVVTQTRGRMAQDLNIKQLCMLLDALEHEPDPTEDEGTPMARGGAGGCGTSSLGNGVSPDLQEGAVDEELGEGEGGNTEEGILKKSARSPENAGSGPLSGQTRIRVELERAATKTPSVNSPQIKTATDAARRARDQYCRENPARDNYGELANGAFEKIEKRTFLRTFLKAFNTQLSDMDIERIMAQCDLAPAEGVNYNGTGAAGQGESLGGITVIVDPSGRPSAQDARMQALRSLRSIGVGAGTHDHARGPERRPARDATLQDLDSFLDALGSGGERATSMRGPAETVNKTNRYKPTKSGSAVEDMERRTADCVASRDEFMSAMGAGEEKTPVQLAGDVGLLDPPIKVRRLVEIDRLLRDRVITSAEAQQMRAASREAYPVRG